MSILPTSHLEGEVDSSEARIGRGVGKTTTRPIPTIRPATPADAGTIVRFNLGLASESEGLRLNETTLRTGVESLLGDPNKGFYTLAEIDGVIAGQVLITFEWSDWRNGWFWWIQSVYVAAEFRRSGVFRQLFEHLKSKATAQPDVIGIRLYVEKENARAQKTYATLGLNEEHYAFMGLYPLPGRLSAISHGLESPPA